MRLSRTTRRFRCALGECQPLGERLMEPTGLIEIEYDLGVETWTATQCVPRLPEPPLYIPTRKDKEIRLQMKPTVFA